MTYLESPTISLSSSTRLYITYVGAFAIRITRLISASNVSKDKSIVGVYTNGTDRSVFTPTASIYSPSRSTYVSWNDCL